MHENQFRFKRSTFFIPIVTIITIWFIYFIEIYGGFNFNKFGVYPRTIKGLRGILFSPFVHSNIKHLFNNSMPLFVMLGGMFYFYHKIAFKVIVIGTLLTGFITWLIARDSYHIGASGVIYFLVSFIFFSGIIRKYYRLIALSLIVVFLYGSMIWYIFPTEEHISWEGHLSGFLVGLAMAFFVKKSGPQPENFEYSKNEEFDNLFDDEGNFIPPTEDENDIANEN